MLSHTTLYGLNQILTYPFPFYCLLQFQSDFKSTRKIKCNASNINQQSS